MTQYTTNLLTKLGLSGDEARHSLHGALAVFLLFNPLVTTTVTGLLGDRPWHATALLCAVYFFYILYRMRQAPKFASPVLLTQG